MTQLPKHIPNPYQPILRQSGSSSLRRLLLLPSVVLAVALAGVSCSSSPSPEPRPTVTDTEPVGNGLKVIGYALLGGTVVMVLGSMIKS